MWSPRSNGIGADAASNDSEIIFHSSLHHLILLMPFIDRDKFERRDLFPGFHGHFIHTEKMTLIHWKIDRGSLLPEHSHPHEQVVNMLSGRFELTIDGATRVLHEKMVAVIPSHAVHSGRAITDCRIIDVFYPIREDYR